MVEPKRIQVRGTENALTDLETISVRIDPAAVAATLDAQELTGEAVLPFGVTADEGETAVSVKIVLEELSEETNE